MTDNKLQELIETLKKRGVESGEEASRHIIEEAGKQSEEIIAKAKSEAEGILLRAKEAADKNLRQLHSSLEIAASQFLTSLKRTIEDNLLALPLKRQITENLTDTGFLKELMITCVREYVKRPEQSDLSVLVSKEQQQKLADFAIQLIQAHSGKSSEDRLSMKLKSDGVSFGFIIGTADGAVKLDFTDEAFLELFLRYLTPRFREYFKTVSIQDLSDK